MIIQENHGFKATSKGICIMCHRQALDLALAQWTSWAKLLFFSDQDYASIGPLSMTVFKFEYGGVRIVKMTNSRMVGIPVVPIYK